MLDRILGNYDAIESDIKEDFDATCETEFYNSDIEIEQIDTIEPLAEDENKD